MTELLEQKLQRLICFFKTEVTAKNEEQEATV
jgi:hypothetical protein